jgi:hypothetical protein
MRRKGYLTKGLMLLGGLVSIGIGLSKIPKMVYNSAPLPNEQAAEMRLTEGQIKEMKNPPAVYKQLCVVSGHEHLADFRYPNGNGFYQIMGEVADYIDRQITDLFENPEYRKRGEDRKWVVDENAPYYRLGYILPAVVSFENGSTGSDLRDPMQVFRDSCKDDLRKEDAYHFIPEQVREMAGKAGIKDTENLDDAEAAEISLYTGAGCLLHKSLVYEYDPQTDTTVILGMRPLREGLNRYNGGGYSEYATEEYPTYADKVLDNNSKCKLPNSD